MKITKEYKGITRKENGDYYISGSIMTDEYIEIELDDRLAVEDSIVSMKGIASNATLIAGNYIKAGWGIKAGGSIEAGGGIDAGYGIEAGDGIYAKTYIDCGKRIFAGTSIYENEEADKTISCAELRNGQIAYGVLIITGDGGEK